MVRERAERGSADTGDSSGREQDMCKSGAAECDDQFLFATAHSVLLLVSCVRVTVSRYRPSQHRQHHARVACDRVAAPQPERRGSARDCELATELRSCRNHTKLDNYTPKMLYCLQFTPSGRSIPGGLATDLVWRFSGSGVNDVR